MSVFSELLKTYTERCGMTVVSLAKQCGVDRTTLHKIISGERRPPNNDFVLKLSRLLMLSSSERDKLTEQYEISLVGDELYKRRRNVSEMIRKLSDLGSAVDIEPSAFYPMKRENVKAHSLYHSRQELLRACYSYFAAELEQGCDISIIAQPVEELCNFLKYVSAYYNKSSIKHIFCLDNGSGSGEANAHNLGLFPGICELAYLYSGYTPMYYYDCVDSHINSATLLPVVIIGKSFVMCADNELENGMIFSMPDVVEFYSREFSKLEKMCYVFVERARNIAGMIGTGSSYHDYLLSLDEQPSLMLVSREKGINEGLHLPAEQKKWFIEKMNFLKERYYKSDYKVIFSVDGLRRLMTTGIVKELPGEICSPLSLQERIWVLENMIEKTEQGIYNFRVIESGVSPSERLRINLDTDGAVHFVLRSRGEYVFMTVGEQSVKIAMNDYFTHLFESGKIFDKGRSIEIMRGVLAETKEEFGEPG